MPNYSKSSFLDDFNLPEITHESIKQQLVKVGKVRTVKQKTSLADMPLVERLKYIEDEVLKALGMYRGFVRVIRSEEELDKYIDKAVHVGYLSFDTETNNSLDPLTCKLMGLCLYTPNTKPVYVPINHCVPDTDILLENQISEQYAKEILQKLSDSGTKLVYHNGKFDIRVVRNTLGVSLPIWWDTMIAAQLLNENELAKLKYQYKTHINPTIGVYNIENLFTGLPYAWVDPEIFALYAAIDPYDTYMLQQYQQKIFEKEDMAKLYNLFLNIEVPVVSVTAQMEDNGMCMDTDFLSRLDTKYHRELDKISDTLNQLLSAHSEEIKYYQDLGKLDNPVNFDSPSQLNIVLYDIFKTPIIADLGRSTDKTTLKALKTPFTECLLKYRHYSKLISSFTEPLPNWLSNKDGKLHANFNQLGAEENNVRTGRFSSKNPNMQQIPSHGDTMRMMFKASTEFEDIEIEDDNSVIIKESQDVMTDKGWKKARELLIGDMVLAGSSVEDKDNESNEYYPIVFIEHTGRTYKIYL